MSKIRFISPDITAALDRWVTAIGTPDHQAASEALDDILEKLCEDREAWGQALIEKHHVERALLECADEMDRHAVARTDTVDEIIASVRKEHAKMKASAERTREWLEREGFAIAAAAKRAADEETLPAGRGIERAPSSEGGE